MYKNVYDKYLTIFNKCREIKGYYQYGQSGFSQPLFCVSLGNKNGKKIILHSGIHAREWITIFVLYKYFCNKFLFNKTLKNNYTFIFCSNPDGMRIATQGIKWLPKKYQNYLYMVNNCNDDFSLWKANGRGVDLNVNFDAKWGQGINNINKPSSENYIGLFCESERETKALVNLTQNIKPHLIISFHSKGEEIYYEFGQKGQRLKNDRLLAQKFERATGYRAKLVKGSVGGYKDWCIEKLGISSFTFEVGSDSLSHPICLDKTNEIYNKIKNIFEILENY